MRDNNTINKLRTVSYVAKSFTHGLTDLVLVVRKPDGTLLSPPATFSEVGESGSFDGIYVATYTPDQLGVWQEKISSITNGDNIVTGYEVVAYDDTDNESAISTVNGIVTEIATDTDTIITDVGNVKTELDDVQTRVIDIQTKVNTINSEISTGGYIL